MQYKDTSTALSNLLAIMHGDGGHHENAVGTHQAVEDAIELMHVKWVSNIHMYDINKLSDENKRLKQQLKRYKLC